MSGIDAHLPALQVVVPMLTAGFVVLLKQRGLAWAAASAASAMAFAIAVQLTMTAMGGEPITYEMGNWPAPYGIVLHIDSFSAVLMLIITGASTLSLLGGHASLDSQIALERQPYYYAAWLLAVAGLCGICITGDAFNIFVFMEISSLASYVLIAGGPDRRALPAVFKYLIMGSIGATFYLIGVGLIYLMTGTLNLADMELRIANVDDLRPIYLAAGFITVGLALKAAIFPLHVWLPNAYTWAPHVTTAFMAACATKVMLYILFRFDYLVFQGNLDGHAIQFTGYLLPLSLVAILVGSVIAMLQNNVKSVFAYSSVAQIGYIVLGASLITAAGLTAGVLHIFNHALAKGALFLAIAVIAMACRSMTLEHIGGIAKQMPVTFIGFVIAGLSLIGVPGTAGFISKWYLITASLELGNTGVLIIAIILISSLMAVYYVWRIVEVAAFGERDPSAPDVEISKPLIIALWIAVIANLYFGFVPQLPVTLATETSAILLEVTP
ncbi:MAG: monovalent cation/H+ antiporter subunit D family protein [Pseudomonadota bacterium]